LQKRILIALLSLGISLFCVSSAANGINNTRENDSTEERVVSPQADAANTTAETNAQTQEASDDNAADKMHRVVRRYNARASWYRHGKITANGERYNPMGLTAAHRSLPFGTIVRLTNPENGRVVVIRINDRGPFIRGREFDLSLGSARALGIEEKGLAVLLVEVM